MLGLLPIDMHSAEDAVLKFKPQLYQSLLFRVSLISSSFVSFSLFLCACVRACLCAYARARVCG